MLSHVLTDVRAFADGAKQSDDITMLAVRYAG
jgi:serine phosphatase RsbU (regulator of sigma subunit)